MEELVTRIATAEDHEAICHLAAQVDAYHREILPEVFQEFPGPARPKESIGSAGLPAEYTWIVAELSGSIVGVLRIKKTCSPDLSMFRKAEFALVDDLVVDQAHRQRGIGTLLLKEAKSWARGQGLKSVQLSIWSRNQRAAAFYRRRGFERIVERMEARLS